MVQKAIFWVAVFLLSLSGLGWAQERCVCSGQQVKWENGGNGRPLWWHFGAYVVSAGGSDSPPLICYEKSISNGSDTEVRNILWKIAGYSRRVLFDWDQACPTIPGQLSPEPKSGPLHYGISSESYDTTVLPPRDGWVQKAALEKVGDRSPIISAFNLSTTRSSAAVITITSFLTIYPSVNFLSYQIENSGNSPVRILLNVPVVGPMRQDLPFIDSGLIAPPNFRAVFHSKIIQPVQVRPATLLISDAETQEALAVDVAGVYAPVSGTLQHSDESLFDRIR